MAVVNYPQTEDYTRVTEYKHLTGQQQPEDQPDLRISDRYRRPLLSGAAAGERGAVQALRGAGRRVPDVWFVGRLATYRYYNMDQVVGQALATFSRISAVARRQAAAHGLDLCRGVRARPQRGSSFGRARVQPRPGPRPRSATSWQKCGHLDATTTSTDRGARDPHLRYPLLGRDAARGGRSDFAGQAAGSSASRTLGIRPVAGFLHHGSGPGGLDPAHPDFVEALRLLRRSCRAHVSQTCALHPDQRAGDDRPLRLSLRASGTRMSANERLFLRAVVASAVATAEAMRRIREREPGGRTRSDRGFGRVFATAAARRPGGVRERAPLPRPRPADGAVDREHYFWRALSTPACRSGDLDALRPSRARRGSSASITT